MKAFNAMQSIRIIVFLIVAHQFGTCDGQEKPRYSFPNFSNESVGHNFCYLHRFVEDGKLERRDALRDIDLSIALFSFQLNAKTGAIDKEHPDAAVLFLDELSRRAGFQWRNTYGVIETPKGSLNETYTDVAVWAGHAYDLVGSGFFRSQERVEKGILFSEGWVNANSILVKTTDANKGNRSSFFNFLAPFTNGLWGLLSVTIIATGFIYYLIDYLDSKRYDRKQDLGFKSSMFNAAWLFTGHTLHEPKSAATRLLVFAASFLCLLTVAAYTANLVSFLLPQTSDKIVIKDMDDVIKHDLSCCVDNADFNNEYMKKSHPKVRLVEIEDPTYGNETYHALARSQCDVLITDNYVFRKRKRNSEYNQNCNLTALGTIFDSEGYFPTMDSPDRCTSIVSEVLTLHLLEMKRDKTYDTMWENFFSKSATVICEDEKEENEDAHKVSVANMFGIFVLYFAALLGALLWSFIRFCFSPKAFVAREFLGNLSKATSSHTLHPSAASNLESTREEIRAEDSLGVHASFGQEIPASDDSRTELKEDISSQLHKFSIKLEERDNESIKYIKSMHNNIQRFEEDVKSMNNNIQRFEEDVKSMHNNNIQRDDPRTEQKEDISSQLHDFLLKQQERDNETIKYMKSMNNKIQRLEEDVKSMHSNNIQRDNSRTERKEDMSWQLHNLLVRQQERDNKSMKYMKSMNNKIQRFEENAKSMNDNIQRFEENMSKQLQELQRRITEIEKKHQ